MKKSLFLFTLVFFASLIFIFSSCNNVKLTNQEAQSLVTKTLNLPQKFSKAVPANWNFEPVGKLEREGYVSKYGVGYIVQHYRLNILDKGKPYYMGTQGKDSEGEDIPIFKSFDVDFNEITGIAINKEAQTASVRFSLKAINITPIGNLLEENINNPRNGELVFKKFDNGWQLESDQNKSGVEFVKEIWWGRRNR